MAVKSEYTFKVTRHELIRVMSALFVAQMNANEAYLLTGSSEDKRSYDDNKVTPYNLYFSSDMRFANNDETQVHGRAFTCAMGKHGTTLYPVYLPNGKRYRNADLCGISARYKDNIIKDYYNG